MGIFYLRLTNPEFIETWAPVFGGTELPLLDPVPIAGVYQVDTSGLSPETRSRVVQYFVIKTGRPFEVLAPVLEKVLPFPAGAGVLVAGSPEESER